MFKPRSLTPALLALGALTLLTPAAFAQQETKPKPSYSYIGIKNVKPSEIVTWVLKSEETTPGVMPEGLTVIVPDDTQGAILLSGSKEAVRKFREIVRLLDIPVRTVRLSVRILRPTATAAILSSAPESVGGGTVEARNNTDTPLSLLAAGMFVDLTLIPHVNGDGTIALTSKVGFSQSDHRNGNEARKQVSEASFTHVYRSGVGATVFGIRQGTVYPERDGNGAANEYLIEVTATVVPAPPAGGK